MGQISQPLGRAEDPRTLSLMQWVRRGLNLPVMEIFRRVSKLSVSLPRNILEIRQRHAAATRQGKVIRFVVLTDRMGDIIAAGAALEALKQPNDYVVWVARSAFVNLLEFNPHVDAVMSVSSYTETVLLRRFSNRSLWTSLQIDGALCNMFGVRVNNVVTAGVDVDNYYHRGALVDVYSLIGTGRPADCAPTLYFDRSFDVDAFLAGAFSDPARPLLVFHPASDEFARSWTIEKSEQLAEWMQENTDFNILEVGLSPYLQSAGNVRLLRGDLPLSGQLAIVAKAVLFIGVDSGFSHAANAAGVRSIHLIGRYKQFSDHFPWLLKAQDIVVRSKGQAHEIPVEDVIQAVIETVSASERV